MSRVASVLIVLFDSWFSLLWRLPAM